MVKVSWSGIPVKNTEKYEIVGICSSIKFHKLSSILSHDRCVLLDVFDASKTRTGLRVCYTPHSKENERLNIDSRLLFK